MSGVEPASLRAAPAARTASRLPAATVGARPPVRGARPPVRGARPPVPGARPPVRGARPPVPVPARQCDAARPARWGRFPRPRPWRAPTTTVRRSRVSPPRRRAAGCNAAAAPAPYWPPR
ncbi:hypothetical protein CRI70_29360 [Streptomyces sp. Ru87]|nr:hypothetical protein CRI70_29360 [Streptomyces sp. Ru87]